MSCIGVMYQPYNSYAAANSPNSAATAGSGGGSVIQPPTTPQHQGMTSPQPQNNPQQMQTAADDQSPAVAAAAMHFKREICDKELYKAAANANTGAGGEMDLSRLPQAAAETPYPYPQSAGSRQDQYDSPRQ